jgi:hypothetical protein
MPDFIGIGAQKAGTTWLHAMLSKHPKIWMPPRKELHWFDRDPRFPSPSRHFPESASNRSQQKKRLAKDLRVVGRAAESERYRRAAWQAQFRLADKTGSDFYHTLFDGWSGNKVSGEITPAYAILDDTAVGEMAATCPQAKLIFILRNPEHRAWSMIKMRLGRNGLARINRRPKRWKKFLGKPGQLLRGDYLRTLDVYSRHFPDEQIGVFFFDAIRERPAEFWKQVCEFLQVDHYPIPHSTLQRRIHKTHSIVLPTWLEKSIQEIYREPSLELAEKLGGYARRWAGIEESDCPASFRWNERSSL